MKQVFIDVETTGVNHWENVVHQIAGVIEIDGHVADEFDLKVRPHESAIITQEALDVCGKTEAELMAYPHRSEAYGRLIELFGKYISKFNKTDKFFFCAYNAHFDNQFVRSFFAQNDDKYFGSWFWSGSIDVMVLALQYLKPVRNTMPNFQLMTVAEKLGIDIEADKAHDGLYDVLITKKIYDFLMSQTN